MDTNPEIRERILAAANQLFDATGRQALPTVDAVRKLSKTSMNDASAVMREWRRAQLVSTSAAVVTVPERVSQANAAALSALWSEAQEFANESLNAAQAAWEAERAEAEKLRVELSSAFEAQGAELEALKIKLAQVETMLATARVSLTEQTAVTNMERKQHDEVRARLEEKNTELATVRARAEAQAEIQATQADLVERLTAELTQARSATAAAREEAAKLQGQAEAVFAQHVELMQVLKDREGERPKGGKK